MDDPQLTSRRIHAKTSSGESIRGLQKAPKEPPNSVGKTSMSLECRTNDLKSILANTSTAKADSTYGMANTRRAQSALWRPHGYYNDKMGLSIHLTEVLRRENLSTIYHYRQTPENTCVLGLPYEVYPIACQKTFRIVDYFRLRSSYR